ncbi:hypothetical protein [Aurantiacibacter sediminis]|uniref:DUF4345 domain-containing protein n=1 Tax=Aurantiacibacter sediminis TaxID=2793064 RepID=A0ABS0MZI0_9SPHN|nr:hypothetical protein [Aurantiacibacter sediminis]MBH5321122.1 hypothetical protein [Aurantiacibacter sediminis]
MRLAAPVLAYWAVTFTLGFVLGTMRVLWGAEALGETAFVAIEIPIMLGASWLAARWLLRRFAIATAREALVMGGAAFALLMAAELVLASVIGEGARGWLASLTRAPGLYGFLGQIGFALMPRLAIGRR